MAYIFNEDKSKAVIKRKIVEKNGVLGEGTTSVAFTAKQLEAPSLDAVTVLEIRQTVVDDQSSNYSGQIINGKYVSGTEIYPSCFVNYGSRQLFITGYNPDNRLRKIIFEITYLIGDITHH